MSAELDCWNLEGIKNGAILILTKIIKRIPQDCCLKFSLKLKQYQAFYICILYPNKFLSPWSIFSKIMYNLIIIKCLNIFATLLD